MLVGFLCAVSRFRRFLCLVASDNAGALLVALLLPLWLPVWLLLVPVACALRAVFFVRFPRPRRFGAVGRWVCVSSVPACAVLVRPAVVRRRLGVVLWFWCWVPRHRKGGDTTMHKKQYTYERDNYLPLSLFVGATYGYVDIAEAPKNQREKIFVQYQIYCVRHNFAYEAPSFYGLHGLFG